MPADGARKNVVLISFDDAVAFWHYRDLFGIRLETPNLDRICAQSTAFHSAYSQAPVCSPSRASFMSGRAPHQTGITGPLKDIFSKIEPRDMWPYLLKQQGYYCSSGGKVMRGFVPLPPQEHSIIYSDQPKNFRVDWRVPDAISIRMGGFRGGRATTDEKDDDRFYDHQSATSAISFLDSYDGDAPFYREVGFYGPHGPWITPQRFKDMYDFRRIKVPEPWKQGFDKNDFIDRVAAPNIDASRIAKWRRSVRNYFSALTHADHHLGRVWDAIKSSRHADNTVVIILSDHGLHLGERNRFRKTTLWEQVANVPLIIHDPQRPVAQVVRDPVALLDVGPTVMDFAGLPPLQDCPGRSLRPQMGTARDPDRAVPTFLHGSASVRKGNYRFIRYEDGSTQFFDLASDWWQTRDLGPDHPDFEDMRAVHADCCRKHGLDVVAAATAA